MKYIYLCATNPDCDTIEKVQAHKIYEVVSKLKPIFHIDDIVVDICPDGIGEQKNLKKILETDGNIIITTKPNTLASKYVVLNIIDDIVNSGNKVLFCEQTVDGQLKIDTLSTISIEEVL